MQFHRQVFGANVRLSEDCTSAWRRSPERSFCDSLVFSDRPLIYCHPIRIHLQSTPIHGWKGGASIGLTCHEPATFCAARNTAEDDATTETALPSLATPIGLCEQSGVWLRPLPTECLNRLLHIILQPHATGIELIVIMTSEQKYSLLSSLPVQDPLWLVIDLFGQSYRVDLVQSIDTESISCQLISHNSTSSTNGHGTKTSKEDDTSEPTNKDGGAKDEPSLYTKEHPFKQLQDDKDLTLLQIRHVPATVLSGGPKALETYTNECKDGAVLYNSVRLFLIGPSGGGKSTLRQQLIGGRSVL